MSILPQLAHSLARRDEGPNKDLARWIATTKNRSALQEVVDGLHHNTRDIQHDCISVLYEVGRREPRLIVDYLPDFLALLKSTNNRMQWGAMSAIDSITVDYPAIVYAVLPQIVDAADKGSVITRDHAVFILVKLSAVDEFREDALELLLAQLRTCPANQLPMYAERLPGIMAKNNSNFFIELLRARLTELQTPAKRKRVEGVIKKIALI